MLTHLLNDMNTNEKMSNIHAIQDAPMSSLEHSQGGPRWPP